MDEYLKNSEYIDWKEPSVTVKAAELSSGSSSDVETARRCFWFVRDAIRHSRDYSTGPVTCKASEVLAYGTGYCYAKAHLLAALLRACGIPAGLCYQRLLLEEGSPRHCLHGLNAIYLKGFGWYRADPRGNKPGVAAEFDPPVERLAFEIKGPAERDMPEILPEPLPVVVRALTIHSTVEEVYLNLPDIEPAL